jgi:hypothetical protein
MCLFVHSKAFLKLEGFLFGGKTMTEVWKLDNQYYAIYTDNKKVMNRIKRSYHDFEIMAEYFKFDKLLAIQYRIPIRRKRSAFHLAEIDTY